MSDLRIAQAFAAAADYDRHAHVQRVVAGALARRITALPLPTRPRVLEIGCGTGFLTQALYEQGLRGDWLVTDVTPAMVERAQARMQDLDPQLPAITFATLNGETASDPGSPFDLICASLATQWFRDEPATLARWREWLAPDGHLMVATLGPGTFAEWGAAHLEQGLTPGTPAFTPIPALEALAPAEPLSVEYFEERHSDARAFLHALRAIGAHTASTQHRPLGPAALRRVMRSFEAGGATASYEVVTCHLTRANRQP